MTLEYIFDIVWVAWTAVGASVQAWVAHKAMRDFQWVKLSNLNGSNERDACEALHAQVIFFVIQASMFVMGVWRINLEPDPSYYYRWDPPNKLMVGTIAVMIVSSLLLWTSLRNLRLRRIQSQEAWERKTGQKQTRKYDAQDEAAF